MFSESGDPMRSGVNLSRLMVTVYSRWEGKGDTAEMADISEEHIEYFM
jgi:hypothetical protein